MADIVGGAIGTQKQFSGRPEGLYQKQLLTPSFSAKSATPGMDLANALGVLGGSIINERDAAEKGKEKVGIAEAERISAQATDADKKKLTAIELINNYGSLDVVDNPYAVVTIEKMRGQYLSAQMMDEYMAQREQQERAKTADEEVQRLNKYAQEYFGKVVGQSSNPEAFKRGYYERHAVNQLNAAGTQRTEKSLEYQAIREGSLKATLGEILHTAPTAPPEEIIKAYNNAFVDPRLSGMSIGDRVKVAQDSLKELAALTGDWSLVEKVAKEVVIGTNIGRGPRTKAGPEGTPEGLVTSGNIDLTKRPTVKNKDGSISTVASQSFNIDGKEVLLPTVSDDGKLLSAEEALDLYHKTGKHLGIFDTPEHATAYAKALHETQDEYYGKSEDAPYQVHLSDLTDLTPYRLIATQRNANLFGERIQKATEEVQKMAIPEQNAYFRDLQKTDPELFEALTARNLQEHAYKYQKDLERKKQIAALKQQAGAAAQQMEVNIIGRQWRAYLAGNTVDAAGDVVAATKGAMPEVEYTETDEEGNTKTVRRKPSDQALSAACLQLLTQNAQRTDLSDEEKTREAMRIIGWGPFDNYRGILKSQISNALNSGTLAKMKTDTAGNAVLSDQFRMGLEMARVDPGAFRDMFGDSLANQVETIKTYAEGYNGDWEQATSLYMVSRENMKDKEFARVKRQEIQEMLSSSNMSGFMDLDGNQVKPNVALGTNRAVAKNVEEIALALACGNMDSAAAVNAAKRGVVNSMYVWEGTAVPRGFFSGIQTDQKAAVGKKVLDWLAYDFCANVVPGLARQNLSVSYQPDSNAIIFEGGGGYKRYTADQIAGTGNWYLQHQGEAAPEESSNWTPDDFAPKESVGELPRLDPALRARQIGW